MEEKGKALLRPKSLIPDVGPLLADPEVAWVR